MGATTPPSGPAGVSMISKSKTLREEAVVRANRMAAKVIDRREARSATGRYGRGALP